MFVAVGHIMWHMRKWVEPAYQLHVCRIALLVPIFCVCSWLSVMNPNTRPVWEVVRETYEAFAIYSFFVLNINFLGKLFVVNCDQN